MLIYLSCILCATWEPFYLFIHFTKLTPSNIKNGWLAVAGSPDFPLSSNVFQLSLGDPEHFPCHIRYTISPVCSGRTPGSPTCWMCLENLQMPRKHPDKLPKPPQMAPFNTMRQRLYSELPLDVWALYPVSKCEPSHPTGNTLFGCLYSRSHPFFNILYAFNLSLRWSVELFMVGIDFWLNF